jgi:formate hydrogenlyase subunit 7
MDEAMTSWIRQALGKGIVTTAFPRAPATDEELPRSGRAPTAGPVGLGRLSPEVRASCPTGAITASEIDQGKCVRCARCLSGGLTLAPTPSLNVGRRDQLHWPEGRPPIRRAGEGAPLANLRRSLHVFLIDVGSCQGCNLEVLGLTNPYYDLHRLGIFFTNSPRHADVLVVVGVPTAAMVEPLRRTFEAMPAPKAVLAVGACTIDGGIFADAPARASTVAEILPVDLYVAGCPPPPIAILEGILELGGRGRGFEEGSRS